MYGTGGNGMTYGEYIKEIRTETGMTMKEFAAYFDIPLRTFEAWEGNTRKMPPYVLRLMTYRLQVEKLIKNREQQLDEVIHDNK